MLRRALGLIACAVLVGTASSVVAQAKRDPHGAWTSETRSENSHTISIVTLKRDGSFTWTIETTVNAEIAVVFRKETKEGSWSIDENRRIKLTARNIQINDEMKTPLNRTWSATLKADGKLNLGFFDYERE